MAIKVRIKKDPKAGKEKIISEFEKLPKAEKVKFISDDDNSWNLEINVPKGVDVREDMFRKIVALDMVLLELHQEETSLEDIFRKLTTV